MKIKYIGIILLLLFSLASCNDNDDVVAIFTGKISVIGRMMKQLTMNLLRSLKREALRLGLMVLK